MNWLAARSREATTYHGLIWLAILAGIHISPELREALIQLGTALSSVVLVVQKERRHG